MDKSESIEKLFAAGLEALKLNNNEKGLEIFEQIITKEPENAFAWNQKGMALRKIGKIDEALNCFNKALTIQPNLIQSMLNKASALKMLKQFDLALFTYEDILELEPEHVVALDESEHVKALLTKRAKLISSNDFADQETEENLLFKEKRDELVDFLQESMDNISESIDKIMVIYKSGIKEEALEHRNKIINAMISFNEQLQERVKHISVDFITLDFTEENRDLIDRWIAFKEEKIVILQNLL